MADTTVAVQSTTMTAEYVSQHFLTYMFDNTKDRHVQRVAGWIGMLVRAIELRKDDWQFLYTRQFAYRVGPTWYKVRYRHSINNGFNRGGIQILKMNGNNDGPVVHTITSITDLERFYLNSLASAVGQL